MATFDQLGQRVGEQHNEGQTPDSDDLYNALFGRKPEIPPSFDGIVGSRRPSALGPSIAKQNMDDDAEKLSSALAELTLNAMLISSKALILLNQLALSSARLTPNQRAKADDLAAAFAKAKIEHIWGQEA